ncbi:MAG: class I tRNA ligase family protein [Saprospiraceae bacterium]
MAALKIFTTRPDTIFGVSFMVIAPEHPLVDLLTTSQHLQDVKSYLEKSKLKTERDRLSYLKQMSGVFTGSYCIHPFTGEDIPVWISDYVLIEYGTGAIMAVPDMTSVIMHLQLLIRSCIRSYRSIRHSEQRSRSQSRYCSQFRLS